MKKFEELDLLDNFMMNALVTNEEFGAEGCRLIVNGLMQREVGDITVEAQKIVVPDDPVYRGVRLDVEIREVIAEGNAGYPSMNIYDIEPHLQKNLNLPKHNRFYQARVDGRHMHSGDNNFGTLPNLYVMTILNFDPFGYGQMVYNIHNKCDQVPELVYDDGLDFLYFNVAGTKGGNEEMHAMLRYLGDSVESNAVNDATRRLHDMVHELKIRPKVRDKYMTMGDYIDALKEEAISEGLEQGREQGREQGLEQGREQGREQGLEQGRKQGLEQGLEQGREQGLEQGRKQGLEQGFEQGRCEIITRMLRRGSSLEDISDMTGVDMAKVRQIKASLDAGTIMR
jgi:predicted transposase/invertase (TIGR01784 family)